MRFVAIFCALFLSLSGLTAVQTPQKPKLDVTVESSLGFEQTVEALKMAAAAEKYGYQGMHDVAATLAKKGFPRERLVVLEFCNPKNASEALKEDIMIGLMIPCPIMVWQKGSKVMVSTMDGAMMGMMFEGKNMKRLGKTVAADLRRILAVIEKK